MSEITFHAPIFEPRYCKWMLDDSRKALKKGGQFARSNHEWDPEIIRASAPVLVRDFHPLEAGFILSALNDSGLLEGYDYDVMNYAWFPLSYIPWHNDGHVTCAATIFLNEEWDPNWGGLFLYRQDDTGEIRAIAPSFNSGIRNTNQVSHATSIVALDAPEPRFTIQIFARVARDGAEKS